MLLDCISTEGWIAIIGAVSGGITATIASLAGLIVAVKTGQKITAARDNGGIPPV